MTTASELIKTPHGSPVDHIRQLREMALNDPVLWQLLGAYDAGHFKSWEDFLFNSVLTLAEIKNSLHKRLEEEISHKPSPPIYLNITSQEQAALLTAIKDSQVKTKTR